MGFAPFVSRSYDRPQDVTVTLHSFFSLTSPVTGLNGSISTVNWLFYDDASRFAGIYKYFEIQSCRIRVSNATTSAAEDSFQSLSVAYFPINYIVEGLPLTAPSNMNVVNELPGSVLVQSGAKNFGRWFNPNIKQAFATSDAFSSSLGRAAGVLVWYCNDVGISEIVGYVDIECTVKFYQREYNASPSLFMISDRTNNGKAAEDDKSDKTVLVGPALVSPLGTVQDDPQFEQIICTCKQH